jgi:hypothetical protein
MHSSKFKNIYYHKYYKHDKNNMNAHQQNNGCRNHGVMLYSNHTECGRYYLWPGLYGYYGKMRKGHHKCIDNIKPLL